MNTEGLAEIQTQETANGQKDMKESTVIKSRKNTGTKALYLLFVPLSISELK